MSLTDEREDSTLGGKNGSRTMTTTARRVGSAVIVGIVFFGVLILGMSAPHG